MRSLGFSPTEKQLAAYTKQWTDRGECQPHHVQYLFSLDTRITIQDFMPIYGALKKDNFPVSYDQLVSCLANFEREQEGFIMETDLRHLLENMGI